LAWINACLRGVSRFVGTVVPLREGEEFARESVIVGRVPLSCRAYAPSDRGGVDLTFVSGGEGRGPHARHDLVGASGGGH
jgi:hypothetical protein